MAKRKTRRSPSGAEQPPLPKPERTAPEVRGAGRAPQQHHQSARGKRPGPGTPPRPLPSLPRKVPQDQGPHK
jgi:hypothetical protein